jgi:hypothetical protein
MIGDEITCVYELYEESSEMRESITLFEYYGLLLFGRTFKIYGAALRLCFVESLYLMG